jgi:hypothetical protein
MAARRPRPRRWYVRRRRFLDAEGYQVTDTWLNLPLLPRRILTWRSPDWSVGNRGLRFKTFIISGHGVPTRRDFIAQGILSGVLTALVVVAISLSIVTNQWMKGILYGLPVCVGLGSTIFRWWRTGHQP